MRDLQPLIYRRRELVALLGLGNRTLDEMVKTGEFPPGRRIGRKAIGWTVEEIQNWIQSRPMVGGAGRSGTVPTSSLDAHDPVLTERVTRLMEVVA